MAFNNEVESIMDPKQLLLCIIIRFNNRIKTKGEKKNHRTKVNTENSHKESRDCH